MIKMPFAKTKNILVQQTANEILIYNLETNQVFCLNETAAFIWQNCDGKKTISDLKQINSQLDDDLILLTLDLLGTRDLLDKAINTKFTSERLNRRNMIAKYGSMAFVLPLVTAIVAPKSINAASVCVDNGPISVNNPGPANCSICPAVNAPISNALACCPGTTATFINCDSSVCDYDCV